MDEIKRKLALIDAQLVGDNRHARLVATAPLLFLALGLTTGIVLQSIAETSLSGPVGILAWGALLVITAAATCAYALATDGKPHPHILAYAAALCFVCLGAIRLIAFATPASHDVRRLVGTERVLATIRGRILTQPYQEQRDWCFAPFAFSDPSTTFYLKVDLAQTAQGWTKITGTVRVYVDEPTVNLEAGDHVELQCWLRRFDGPTNPGQFDVAEYLSRRNIYVGASVPSRDAIVRLQSTNRTTMSRLRGRVAGAVAQALSDRLPRDTATEGLLQALLLGSRRDIDPDTYEAFRKTGLLHFISLSGLHLGIFVGIIWWLGKVAGLSKPYQALVCIAATAAFLLVVPPRAPTIRAAVIVWVYCAALLLRRRTNPLNSLCLAAIILLLIRPTQLFEVGWQLSFAAVAGILALTDRVQEFISGRLQGLTYQRTFPAQPLVRLLRRAGVASLRLFATGIAAWVGGAGILLYHFYTITPLASLWTVLVFPLVGLILVAGFAKIVLFFFLPTLSGLLGLFVSSCAALLIGLVKFIANLEVNCILIGHVALWLPVAYYGLVLFASFVRTRHVVLKKWLCVIWTLALIGCLGTLKWQRTYRNNLILTVLDVGHGQAIVAQLPGTETIIFDAGSLYTANVGARIVVPFLDYMGLGRIDSLVISHGDIDHINGIPELVAARPVGHIYAHDAFFTNLQNNRPSQHLIACLAGQGYRIESMPQTIQAGGATITVLWPPDGPEHPNGLSDNDLSLVSLIEFNQMQVLLCSDIEQFAQQQIMARYPELRADVVVSPHHGSPTTLDKRFIESLQPSILLTSGSRSDYERRRHAIEAGSARPFHTSETGAIKVCLEASGRIERTVFVHAFQGE